MTKEYNLKDYVFIAQCKDCFWSSKTVRWNVKELGHCAVTALGKQTLNPPVLAGLYLDRVQTRARGRAKRTGKIATRVKVKARGLL